MDTPNQQKSIWKAGVLWLVSACLIMAVLVPVFFLIWMDRTQSHTADECSLLADAVLKQGTVDKKRIQKNELFLQTYLFSLNAMTGWAYSYGGTDEREISRIYDSEEYIPDGVAVLKAGEVEVLSGSFPEAEFYTVLEKREQLRSETSEKQPDSDHVQQSEGTSTLIEDNGVIYLTSGLPNAGTVVITKLESVPELLSDSEQELDLISLESSSFSNSRFRMVLVRLSDNTILKVIGDLPIAEGDILTEVPDDSGILKLGNDRYICGTSEDNSYRIYALMPVSSAFARTVVSPFALALIFVLLFLLTCLYAWFLRTDILRGRVEQDGRTDGRERIGVELISHVRLMFYILAACTAALILLICILHVVDSNRVWENGILSDVERYFAADDANAEHLASYRKESKLSALDKIRDLIEASPERRTDNALSDLSGAIERDLFVLNDDGMVIASSVSEYDFTGMSDPESELYDLTSVLEGKADHRAVAVSGEGTSSQLCWAVRCKKIGGMLVSRDSLSQAISFSDYYANYKLPPGLTLFAVDLSTGEILSSSEEEYSGKSAGSIGLKEEYCQDGFAGEIMLNGRRYFVQTSIHGEDRADLIAADLGFLMKQYLPIILATIVAGLLAVILICMFVYKLQRSIWTDLTPGREEDIVASADRPARRKLTVEERRREEEKRKEEARDEETATFYREQEGGLRADRSAVGRWLNPITPFKKQSADEKFREVIQILSIVLLIAGYAFYQHSSQYGLQGSTFAYLLQRSWRYGLNVYAVTYALMMIFQIFVIGLTLRKLILMAGKKYGNRGETVARLVGSFIAYASIAAAVAYSLVYVGVNATTVFASAGIIGLAISIGAKDLISDIFAGISIVFEGEFRTGDIVDIGGYRGTVEEIGVRTTKIMSMENVKIFRNSNISGVVNMTQRYSIAEVRVDVSRAEPLEKVETLFRKELPKIRKKIPETVSDIELCGIDQLNANGLVLLFQTKCREEDRISVERMLRRELDLLMEREHLGSMGQPLPAPPPPPNPTQK